MEIINADVVTYDLGSNIYKGIWARNSIHHIPERDLDPVFKKLADALVEGGYLFVIVREGEGEFVEEDVKNYLRIQKFYHLFTEDELRSRGEKAGLTLERIDHNKRSHKWLVGIFRK
ncbi:MAG: hypothetical protein TR69_WS6001000856 [candidate division WS6 bacterium OLB20]|uniref:Methyltransferase type 11 domain-containing protein n=1 Tax=candidate division WS6 bacterium OLB20 TaxID=1617426 RepID=A0A136LYW3_9BACT|nr:MAG: hypothetical protein TR69_WS6001000856 [candidate division WS6 bacterium OLB20]